MTNNAYSYIKIFKHVHKLNSIKRREITSPISIRIKPTNICNCDCFYCSYINSKDSMRELKDNTFTFNKSDEIPQNIMRQLVDNLIDMKLKSVVFSGGGEPLLYPNIEKFTEKLYNNEIDTAFITNGINLQGSIAKSLSKCKWIRISIDSYTPELYSKIRKVSSRQFIKICNNIKEFIKIKELYCEIGANYVINHMNYNQVYNSTKFFKELGLNHIKFYPRVTSITSKYHDNFEKQVKEDIKKAERDFNSETFTIINKYEDGLVDCIQEHRNYTFCPIMQIIPVIAADSKVYVCHDKAYTKDGLLGDLREKNFKDIWFSENTRYIFNNFDLKKHCRYHCAYDQRNLLINEYLNLNDDNINFI